MLNAGQQQRERPQDKTPHTETGVPPIDTIDIEPVDDILEELEKLKKEEHKRCGCWS